MHKIQMNCAEFLPRMDYRVYILGSTKVHNHAPRFWWSYFISAFKDFTVRLRYLPLPPYATYIIAGVLIYAICYAIFHVIPRLGRVLPTGDCVQTSFTSSAVRSPGELVSKFIITPSRKIMDHCPGGVQCILWFFLQI